MGVLCNGSSPASAPEHKETLRNCSAEFRFVLFKHLKLNAVEAFGVIIACKMVVASIGAPANSVEGCWTPCTKHR